MKEMIAVSFVSVVVVVQKGKGKGFGVGMVDVRRTAFGGGVVEQVRTTDIGVDRGVVDDCVACFHLWEQHLGEIEEWVDVGVKGFMPLFV